MRWRIVQRHYFMQNNGHVRCAAFHADTNLLVAGFSNGIFGLYEMPDFNPIHTLSISQNEIDFVTINNTGEWLAFGASKLGQLLVWEWQSESYILKQQGHFDSMNSLVYSQMENALSPLPMTAKLRCGTWTPVLHRHIYRAHEWCYGMRIRQKGQCTVHGELGRLNQSVDLIRFRNFRHSRRRRGSRFLV